MGANMPHLRKFPNDVYKTRTVRNLRLEQSSDFLQMLLERDPLRETCGWQSSEGLALLRNGRHVQVPQK